MEKQSTYSTFIVVGIFAIAMGFLEAIVVVYLRELYYPHGFTFPLSNVPAKILFTEFLREITTIVMLVCIAVITGKNNLQRFACFIFTFGVWDIFYYIGLKSLLNWPESLLTWDILFLIPVPWVGPVLAPLICSITMIVFAWCIIYSQKKGITVTMGWPQWSGVILGSFIIFCTFIWDYSSMIIRGGFLTKVLTLGENSEFQQMTAQYIPTRYHWLLFFVGEILIAGSIGMMMYNSKKQSS